MAAGKKRTFASFPLNRFFIMTTTATATKITIRIYKTKKKK